MARAPKAIAWPTVTAESRDGNQSVTISGDASGNFTIALLPGRYDVTARAFGFNPATRYAVEVPSGVQTSTTITLTAQPAGSFFGRVTDLQTGAPLSATIDVEETPVVVQTDPNTGLYSVALPQGEYQASIRAEAHRIGHLQMAVTEGLGKQADIELPSAPRILLVDSGRWYYESQIRYFEEALTALDYPFLQFGQVSSSEHKQPEFLGWCVDVAWRRAEAIVSGQHRGSYNKAAVVTTACAEVLRLRGDRTAADAVVSEVRDRFIPATAPFRPN